MNVVAGILIVCGVLLAFFGFLSLIGSEEYDAYDSVVILIIGLVLIFLGMITCFIWIV